MPCYQCSHCNKCGIFSNKLELTCGICGTPVVPGVVDCPGCGTAYSPKTMVRGEIKKPEGTVDWMTELNDYLESTGQE